MTQPYRRQQSPAWECRCDEYEAAEYRKTIRAPSPEKAALKFVRWCHRVAVDAGDSDYDSGIHGDNLHVALFEVGTTRKYRVTVTVAYDIRFHVTESEVQK